MHIAQAKLGQADAGDNEAKLMTKLAPKWVRTRDPVIRSPARYRWTTAPAYVDVLTEASLYQEGITCVAIDEAHWIVQCFFLHI